MTPRGPRRLLLLALGILLAWLLGAVVVRLGLDWSDTFPYSEASEWRYLAVAVVALTVVLGGSIASILVFRRVSAPRDRRR